MRILLTADPELPVPPGGYGGIERLVDMWRCELRARGHTVGLAARRDSTAKVDRLFPWPGARSQSAPDTVRNSLALWRSARAFRADVVHSSSRLIYTLPLLLAGIPVVQTYHRFPGPRQVRIAARLGRRLVFTGVSEFIAQLGRGGGGRWVAVPNCIDIDRLDYRSAVAPDAPLVFLSRIERVKGAREAIAIARAAGRPLILAGNHSADADATRYWREEIAPLVDGRLVTYAGAVDDAQKSALLGRAAALLVPVQWDEPFGLVFAEALACGTPVIASPRGALPEIVREAENGFLVRTRAEGVAAVRAVPGLSRAFCRRDAEARFSPRAAVDRFLTVYDEVRR
ncbi:MAG TPA: glycosyltransferase [Opitutus sp.]|nr:glycosyltransferase [Opitutus sp.]